MPRQVETENETVIGGRIYIYDGHDSFCDICSIPFFDLHWPKEKKENALIYQWGDTNEVWWAVLV